MGNKKSGSSGKGASSSSDVRKKLIGRIRRQSQEDYNSAGDSGFHRSAYHRHFDGYKELKYRDPTGKTVIERTYVGDWYEPALSRENQIRLRVLYVLLAGFGIAAFVFGALRQTPCNSVIYVALFQALAIAMIIWLIYVLIFYVPTLGRMTIGDYNTLHAPLIRASLMCTIALWGSAAGSVLSCFLNAAWTDLICTLIFAAGGLMFFLINRLENMLHYHVLPNDTQAPDESVEIT